MTMASGVYQPTMIDAFDATQLAVDLSLDSHKVALVTDTYTPNFQTHDLFNDVTNEISGTGYSAGGKAITGLNPALTNDSGIMKYDIDDLAWASATFTARGAVMYLDALTNDPLLAAWTFGADITATAGTFTIAWHSTGLIRVDWIP